MLIFKLNCNVKLSNNELVINDKKTPNSIALFNTLHCKFNIQDGDYIVIGTTVKGYHAICLKSNYVNMIGVNLNFDFEEFEYIPRQSFLSRGAVKKGDTIEIKWEYDKLYITKNNKLFIVIDKNENNIISRKIGLLARKNVLNNNEIYIKNCIIKEKNANINDDMESLSNLMEKQLTNYTKLANFNFKTNSNIQENEQRLIFTNTNLDIALLNYITDEISFIPTDINYIILGYLSENEVEVMKIKGESSGHIFNVNIKENSFIDTNDNEVGFTEFKDNDVCKVLIETVKITIIKNDEIIKEIKRDKNVFLNWDITNIGFLVESGKDTIIDNLQIRQNKVKFNLPNIKNQLFRKGYFIGDSLSAGYGNTGYNAETY